MHLAAEACKATTGMDGMDGKRIYYYSREK